MKVLIIGGRDFLGRHIVEKLLEQDDIEFTLLNRGLTNPELFARYEVLKGDRNQDLSKLIEGRQWDFIIDTCGYMPLPVDRLAKKLKTIKNHYIFISTCSVYNHTANTSTVDEEAPIVDIDIRVEDTTPATYGARKYLCEKTIQRHFKDNFTAIRAGLIVGKYDNTFRFPYWVQRFLDGGKILAPGDPSAPLQIIDAADIANFIIHIIQNKVSGTFNVTGPEKALSLGEFLETARNTLNPEADIEWVSEEFLIEQSVTPWTELPLWLPRKEWPFLKRGISLAKKNGLNFSPVEKTLIETSTWLNELAGKEERSKSTLTREREKELLAKWASPKTQDNSNQS